MNLIVNGKLRKADVDPDTPLLWVLRDNLELTGTKFGCGIARCGACTVHLDGKPVRSCVTKVREVGEQPIVTIEGLAPGDKLHPVQEVWIEHAVPQCGYCQVGQIMSTVAMMQAVEQPDDDDINRALSGNLCRCGTYPRMKEAIKALGKKAATPQDAEAEEK